MLRLNDMDPEHLESTESAGLRGAEAGARRGRPAQEGARWLAAACAANGLARPAAVIRERLAAAARAYAAYFRAPPANDSALVPYTFWLAHSVCTWAGEGPALSRAPRALWADDEGGGAEGLRELLSLLLAELDGAPIADGLASLRARPWPTAFATRVVVPAAGVHHAIATRSPEALQPALDRALAGHVWLAGHELRTSPHGLLALPLLGPLSTARRLGIPFDIDTPYLPIALLEPSS